VRAVLDIALRDRAAHEGGPTSPTGALDETLVRAMLSQLRLDRPTISAEPAWQRLCALRRAVIIQEMTRAFLASCTQGRDPQANAIARRLLASARTWPDADRATSARALARQPTRPPTWPVRSRTSPTSPRRSVDGRRAYPNSAIFARPAPAPAMEGSRWPRRHP
jgi:hypothetical protein